MAAPLSVVIPTLDAEQELPNALQCLIEGISAGLIRELVISDGGSRDATLPIADTAGAVVVSGTAGRGGQLRRGAGVASGQWMLFLHADTHSLRGGPARWRTTSASQKLLRYSNSDFAPMGSCRVLVAGWANLRSKMGLPYGDQGLLISRELYDKLEWLSRHSADGGCGHGAQAASEHQASVCPGQHQCAKIHSRRLAAAWRAEPFDAYVLPCGCCAREVGQSIPAPRLDMTRWHDQGRRRPASNLCCSFFRL